MELKIISGVIIFSLAVLGIALLIPKESTQSTQGLPWQIEHVNNTTRVFGLTLGQSTLSDAEKILQGNAEINLFESENGKHSLEAYFDKIELGGLTAKMILVMDFSESDLADIYQRGLRISKLGSGSDKVSISTEDLHRTRNAKIASITYLPRIDLSATQLEARFGKASKIIHEPGTTAEHWLYPQSGLDVTLDENAKEVLQYVIPSQFSQITEPLLQKNTD